MEKQENIERSNSKSEKLSVEIIGRNYRSESNASGISNMSKKSTSANKKSAPPTPKHRRVSSLALDILTQSEDIDSHPYGRGGIYEGLLYIKRKTTFISPVMIALWVVFFIAILIGSLVIVVVAEIYRQTNSTTAEINESRWKTKCH